MERERSIRKRLEQYGEELLQCRATRKKLGLPNAIHFPREDVSAPEFWNNEKRIEELEQRINEILKILEEE